MKPRHIAAFLALLAFCLSPIFAAGAKEEVYKMRTSTNLAPGGTVGQALKFFVENVGKEAGGRIKATANYGNELGSQREQVEMTKTGSLEMVVSAPGTGPGAWVPQLQMFEFPYLFKDEAHYVRVLNGMEAEVSRLVAPHNFIAVGGQNMGFRHMLNKKRPIYEPADLAGLKMRGAEPGLHLHVQRPGGGGDHHGLERDLQRHPDRRHRRHGGLAGHDLLHEVP